MGIARVSGQANVAVLTRESPSAARVSSAFNTKLAGDVLCRSFEERLDVRPSLDGSRLEEEMG